MFEGAFQDIDGGEYHVNTIESYRSSKRPGQDISIVSPLSRKAKDRYARLMIFKDGSSDAQGHANHLDPTELNAHHGCGVEPHMRRIPDVIPDFKDEDAYVELKKRQSTDSKGSCKLPTPQMLPMVNCLRSYSYLRELPQIVPIQRTLEGPKPPYAE
jgi:hypothetical protein